MRRLIERLNKKTDGKIDEEIKGKIGKEGKIE